MLAAFFGWYIHFYPVAVKDSAHFISITHGRESQYGSNLGSQISFKPVMGAKQRAVADIYQQHYSKIPLLFKDFAVGMPEPGRNIPVDKTDIIPRRIFAHFFKRHPLSLEGAVILAREQIPRQLLASYFKLPNFF